MHGIRRRSYPKFIDITSLLYYFSLFPFHHFVPDSNESTSCTRIRNKAIRSASTSDGIRARIAIWFTLTDKERPLVQWQLTDSGHMYSDSGLLYTYNRYKFEYFKFEYGLQTIFAFDNGSLAFVYGLQLEVVLRNSCSVTQETILILFRSTFWGEKPFMQWYGIASLHFIALHLVAIHSLFVDPAA